MIGVSGSGKTTWVNLNKQYIACSTDSILEEKAQKMGISYTEAFDYFQDKKKFESITAAFFQSIRQCIKNDTDFVIDRTHLKRHIRMSLINELRTIAMEHGKHLELNAICFELPNNIIFERLNIRAKATGKIIPKNVILDQINSFDIPTIDEGFDTIERIT